MLGSRADRPGANTAPGTFKAAPFSDSRSPCWPSPPLVASGAALIWATPVLRRPARLLTANATSSTVARWASSPGFSIMVSTADHRVTNCPNEAVQRRQTPPEVEVL